MRRLACRSFDRAALSDFSLPMSIPIPEDSSFQPEGHGDYFSPANLSKLSEFHLRWLGTQGRELGKSSSQLLNDILCEWSIRHPSTRNGDAVSIETARAALDEFIASHHAEFLPVDFSK
jgi:hypothetical protein